MIRSQDDYAAAAAGGDLPLQDEQGQYGSVPKPKPNDVGGMTLATPEFSPVLKAPTTAADAGGALSPYTGGMVTSVAAPPSGPIGDPQLAPPTMTPAAPAPLPAGTSPLNTERYGVLPTGSSGAPITPTANPAASGLLAKLQSEASRELDQPTVWDDDLSAAIKASGARGINENYDRAQTSMDASLADRGINYSTIAGGNIMDLARSRAGALSDLDTSIMRERANALAAGRSSAVSNARGVFGDTDSSARADRSELRDERSWDDSTARADRDEQRTERGYVDGVRNDARDQALQSALYDEQFGEKNDSDWTSLLNQIYGNGASTGNSGVGAIAQAGGTYGTAAGRYGDTADQADQGLGDISQLLAQYLGTGQ